MDVFVAGDLCSTLALLGVLGFLGTWMVGRRDSLRTWGLRLGAAAFLGFGGHEAVTRRASTADRLLPIALETLIAAGFVVAGSWMLLPVTCWVHEHTLGALVARIRRWRWAWIDRARARQFKREQERKRRDTEEYDRRMAPEWERQARDREQQERARAQAQRRRENARARVELAYNLQAPEIGERFSRELFDDFCKRYLSEERAPEDVERRAQELLDMLQGHAAKVSRGAEEKSFAELAQEFEQQRQEIEASNLPPGMKRGILLKLRTAVENKITERVAEDS